MATSAPVAVAVLVVAAALVAFALRARKGAAPAPAPCKSNADCGAQACKSGACAACGANTDCAPGQVCKGGACASCAADTDCSASGASCVGGACTAYAADAGAGVGGCTAASSPACGAWDPLWGTTTPSIPCDSLNGASPELLMRFTGGWCGLTTDASAQAACNATPGCAGYFAAPSLQSGVRLPSTASLAKSGSIEVGGSFADGTHWARTLVN